MRPPFASPSEYIPSHSAAIHNTVGILLGWQDADLIIQRRHRTNAEDEIRLRDPNLNMSNYSRASQTEAAQPGVSQLVAKYLDTHNKLAQCGNQQTLCVNHSSDHYY